VHHHTAGAFDQFGMTIGERAAVVVLSRSPWFRQSATYLFIADNAAPPIEQSQSSRKTARKMPRFADARDC